MSVCVSETAGIRTELSTEYKGRGVRETPVRATSRPPRRHRFSVSVRHVLKERKSPALSRTLGLATAPRRLQVRVGPKGREPQNPEELPDSNLRASAARARRHACLQPRWAKESPRPPSPKAEKTQLRNRRVARPCTPLAALTVLALREKEGQRFRSTGTDETPTAHSKTQKGGDNRVLVRVNRWQRETLERV